MKNFGRMLMIMGLLLRLLSGPFGVCAAQSVEDAPFPQDIADLVLQVWRTRDLGRYMEKPDCPAVKDWSHWEKFELERCTYSVTVNDTKLNATVLMLNPSPSVLVKWSIAACGIKLGLSDKIAVTECAEETLKWILCQSNGQFPVAGIVMEQGRAYSFRD